MITSRYFTPSLGKLTLSQFFWTSPTNIFDLWGVTSTLQTTENGQIWPLVGLQEPKRFHRQRHSPLYLLTRGSSPTLLETKPPECVVGSRFALRLPQILPRYVTTTLEHPSFGIIQNPWPRLCTKSLLVHASFLFNAPTRYLFMSEIQYSFPDDGFSHLHTVGLDVWQIDKQTDTSLQQISAKYLDMGYTCTASSAAFLFFRWKSLFLTKLRNGAEFIQYVNIIKVQREPRIPFLCRC